MRGFKVFILCLSWLKFATSTSDQDSYSSSSQRPSYPTYPTSTDPAASTEITFPLYTTSTEITFPLYTTSTQHPYSTTTDNPTTASPGGDCPDGWIESLEGCFLFHHSANIMTWREAQEECEKLGGFLAEIGSQEEQTFLMSIATLEEELIGTAEWYIGLSDQGHEGRWMWQHSATDPVYTSWATDQPDNQNVYDDCAFMDSEQDYEWVAGHCDVAGAKPLCMRDVTNEGPSSSTPYPTSGTSGRPTTSGYGNYVELRGGTDHSGNVYAVNRNGFLGPVCDDGIENSYAVANVVCRQLGFSYGNPHGGSYYGSVSNDFAMDSVSCSGSETTIQECSYSTLENCDYYEGFGVYCYKDNGQSSPRPIDS